MSGDVCSVCGGSRSVRDCFGDLHECPSCQSAEKHLLPGGSGLFCFMSIVDGYWSARLVSNPSVVTLGWFSPERARRALARIVSLSGLGVAHCAEPAEMPTFHGEGDWPESDWPDDSDFLACSAPEYDLEDM